MADYTVDAEGFITKTDPYDVGVRMRPAVPGVVYEHPENAHSDAPKRIQKRRPPHPLPQYPRAG